MLCPNCHQEIRPGAQFCGNCGLPINQSAFAAPQSPLTPQSNEAPLSYQAPVQPSFSSALPNTPPPAPQSPPAPVTPITPPTPAPASFTSLESQFQSSSLLNTVPPAPGATSPMTPAFAAPSATVAMPIPSTAPLHPTGAGASLNHGNGKAIAAFVLGVLGCVGWLIPILGLTLGLLAVIFGTISLKSNRRVFAIIGVVLGSLVIAVSIFFWVRNTELLLSRNSTNNGSSSYSSTGSTSSGTGGLSINTPCYTVSNLPMTLAVTQTTGSCTVQAADANSGEQYQIKVLNATGLTASNLAAGAQADIKNVVSLFPGSSIANQQSGTFAGKPAYVVTLNTSDGAAAIDYVYATTPQGNLVIVMHFQTTGKNYDLTTLEKNWQWK